VLRDRCQRLRIGKRHQQCGAGHIWLPHHETPTRVHRRSAQLSNAHHDRKGHLSITLSCPTSTPAERAPSQSMCTRSKGSLQTSLSRVTKTRRAALVAHGVTRIAAGGKVTTKFDAHSQGRLAIKHLPAHVRVLLTSRDRPGARSETAGPGDRSSRQASSSPSLSGPANLGCELSDQARSDPVDCPHLHASRHSAGTDCCICMVSRRSSCTASAGSPQALT